MRNSVRLWIVVLVFGAITAWAKDFKLLDGSTISGEVADGNDYGVVFRILGGFSKRIPYSKFTQEALAELAQNQKLAPMVEPFIDLPAPPRPKPKTIVVREVPRVTRPVGRTSLFSSFFTPIGLGIFGVLYLANLLAGYEIAHYKGRPVSVVCGLSALLPVVGPLLFMVSPSAAVEGGEMPMPETGQEALPSAPAVKAAGTTSKRVAVPAASGLRVATAGKQQKAGPTETKVYSRGEYTFNRRFIETQFPGFFRVVPSEAEKDLVFVVRTPKNEYIGKRISRISSNEFFLQLYEGGGKEVSISFGEISQIIVRHKDAKD
ncbi:MAG TPA: hypothetical protein PLW35_09260 [Verrucomicrobiota bacterium]|nr:hypothetical protein [Verrucomicrobiota bacterium]